MNTDRRGAAAASVDDRGELVGVAGSLPFPTMILTHDNVLSCVRYWEGG
jgi:hypothetical protein